MRQAHLDFVLDLHHQLPATGDLCWSPYSVGSALGLAAAGAAGATRQELVRALAPGADLPDLTALLTASATLPEAESAVANSLWADRRLPVREEYLRAVRELPGAAVHSADFRGDPDGSRRAINEDVERTTRGLIRQLLAEGTIDPNTAAVLVNALYLKVAWLEPFPEGATAPASFHAPSGTRQVSTMRQRGSYQYAEVGGWRMATLPTPSPVVVDILLPPGDPDPAGWPSLTAALLAELQSSARPRKLDLALPRFRVEFSVTLNPALQALGVETAFRPRQADFSGICSGEQIFIDLVVHKAVLRADEQGFEGAAATAVVMRLVSMDPTTPLPFQVDRPFLALVRNPRTGAVYFVARVVEPG